MKLHSDESIERAVLTLREMTQARRGQGIGAVMMLEEQIIALREQLERHEETITALRTALVLWRQQGPAAESIDEICPDHQGRIEAFAHLTPGTKLYVDREVLEQALDALLEALSRMHASAEEVVDQRRG